MPSTVSGNVTVDVEGWLAGGQIGHNWRSQRWIYGLEADFQWTGQDGDISGCGGLRCATLSYDLDWFGTVRGRLGYLLEPRALVYVTGGLAYGHVSTDLSISASPVAGSFNITGPAGSDSATKAGWVIGGGLEWALDRKWTLRAEYLYMDLGTIARAESSTTTSVASVQGPQCLTDVEVKHTAQTDFTDQIFRIGLSYRFAEPYTPLK